MRSSGDIELNWLDSRDEFGRQAFPALCLSPSIPRSAFDRPSGTQALRNPGTVRPMLFLCQMRDFSRPKRLTRVRRKLLT